MIDVVNGAKTDDRGVKHSVDERLGVLTGFTLVAVDIVCAKVLIAERIARVGTILMQQPGHHLDQRGFARARLAIPHEGKDETAKLCKRVQAFVKIISHQHLGQLQGLIFGDMVADHLVRLFERHCQGGGFGLGRRGKTLHGEIIGFHMPAGPLKRSQPGRVLGTQGDLFHQRLGKGCDGGNKMRIVRGMARDILIEFPQGAMQGGLAIVGQDLFDLADLDGDFGLVGRQKICRGIAKDIKCDQRLGRQTFGKFGLARGRQRTFEVGTLEVAQTRD